MPIPVETFHCEIKFCTALTTPLRVCKEITIYKSQGITIGEGCDCEREVITLYPKGTMKQPGIDITAIFHAAYNEAFEIRVTYCNDIFYYDLISVERGKA